MMQTLRVKANAKINLGLDVLGKREDGYHDLRMIMQSIRLCDVLELTHTKAPGIRLSTNLGFLPAGEENLAWKAAALLLEEFPREGGVYIHLKKAIPVAAGLAGGSSDAAAVLKGLNRMLDLGLSTEALMERGVRIGADVPYCILGGTALAEGIGERLAPLPPLPACSVVLVKPPVHVSTKAVYSGLNCDAISQHPDIDGQLSAISRGSLSGVASRMANVLETVTAEKFPVILEYKEQLRSFGALNALMSGSGPSVFGLFAREADARRAYEAMRREGNAQLFVTEVV